MNLDDPMHAGQWDPDKLPQTGGTDDYFIEFLFDQMDSYVPGLADSGLVSSWLSYRAEPRDFLPIIGETPVKNYLLATGYGGNGVIEDLGIDNISQIKKKAAIAKAEAEKEIAVAKAEADRQANDARINAEREIAKKNNELSLQKSELKKLEDTKKAEADAAYSIQEQQQRKTIEIATAEASIAKQEKEVILKEREAEVQEKELDAQVKKKAEAEKYARQQQSEAELYERQKRAEAETFETEKNAVAMKATAEAQKFAKEQEAAGIRMVGEAEAEAIRAKGIAEAEAMEKKAVAYQKYNNAAMAEMLIKVLPDIAGKIAEPLTRIDKITIIGSGSDNGVESVADHVPAVMAKLFETMKETVGIDMGELVKAGTYDAAVTRNINITNSGSSETAQPAADAPEASVNRTEE